MNSKLYCINPNTKEYEEVKTIYGINIEEILDLIRDYKMSKDLKFDKFGKLEEIERLNNIIKTLEEDLREMYLTFGEFSEEFTENRIKELKGDSSNE